MKRQHQSTKDDQQQHKQKKVGVTSAGQRLANEAKCWRFHDVPIFSINNITRSLSEEFRRLGESKMIFVEGGAIGIARVIHKLTTHGLSENEAKSHYLVYRKCSFNEPFTIKHGEDTVIVFNGVALLNAHGNTICSLCFKLGMIVTDCGHEVEKVPSLIDLSTLELGIGTMKQLSRVRAHGFNDQTHFKADQINFLLTNMGLQHADAVRLAGTEKFFLREQLILTDEVLSLPLVLSKKDFCFDGFIKRTAHAGSERVIANTLNSAGICCSPASVSVRRKSLITHTIR